MSRMPLLAMLFIFLLLAVHPFSLPDSKAEAQEKKVKPPIDTIGAGCCGKKPAFSDPAYMSFTGQVAVTTHSLANVSFVLTVIDLQNIASATPNVQHIAALYNGPAGAKWTPALLGSIFGVTLDNLGNIYVTASSAYHADVFPNGGTGGEVFKINGVTGAVQVFKQLPNSGAGLGNITYDCQHNSLYVSDIDDGKIYQLDMNGVLVGSWDHGLSLSPAIADNPGQMFTPLGRRVWGVATYGNRLYYAVWWDDGTYMNPSHNTEIWSVGLNSSGNFTGPATLACSLPPVNNNTMPVSDISFSPTGRMLVAERTMTNETTPSKHLARILEYDFNPSTSQWVLTNPLKYRFNPNIGPSSAGGVDYDFAPGGLVWGTADGLHFLCPGCTPPMTDYIEGIGGLPPTGGNTLSPGSVIIDMDNIPGYDKEELGDVEIPCPNPCTAQFSAASVCQGQTSTFVNTSTGGTSWSWSFGDGGTSTLQNPTHLYAATGTYNVTLSVNGGACTITKPVIVRAAPQPAVIIGPATTCGAGTYSVAPQPGVSYAWSVTNGTPASGTGPSINVTWNPTGNGQMSITLSNASTHCSITTQLAVAACNSPTSCCKDVKLDAGSQPPVHLGNGIYTFTPVLSANVPIRHVSATLLSTSLSATPNCGTSGPLNSYITGVTAPTGFTASFPVQYSHTADWNSLSAAGASLTAVAFPFNVQFPPPPPYSNNPGSCKDKLTFCVKYTFVAANCRTCELIKCYEIHRGGPNPN